MPWNRFPEMNYSIPSFSPSRNYIVADWVTGWFTTHEIKIYRGFTLTRWDIIGMISATIRGARQFIVLFLPCAYLSSVAL